MNGNIIIDLIITAEIILLRTLKLIILKYILTGPPPIYKNIKKKYIIVKTLLLIRIFI
jgi:hypothetical protein